MEIHIGDKAIPSWFTHVQRDYQTASSWLLLNVRDSVVVAARIANRFRLVAFAGVAVRLVRTVSRPIAGIHRPGVAWWVLNVESDFEHVKVERHVPVGPLGNAERVVEGP